MKEKEWDLIKPKDEDEEWYEEEEGEEGGEEGAAEGGEEEWTTALLRPNARLLSIISI